MSAKILIQNEFPKSWFVEGSLQISGNADDVLAATADVANFK